MAELNVSAEKKTLTIPNKSHDFKDSLDKVFVLTETLLVGNVNKLA